MSLLISFRGPRRRQILLPAKPRRRRIDVRRSFWGAHNHSAGSVDGGFGALGDLLEALLVASRCPRDLQSLKISCQEPFRCKSELPIGLRSLQKPMIFILERLSGALLGYFELHFGSQEAPWELFGGCQRLLEGS